MQLAKDCGNVFDKRYNTDRRPLSNLTSASVNGGKMAIQIWQGTAKENAAAERWHHIRMFTSGNREQTCIGEESFNNEIG